MEGINEKRKHAFLLFLSEEQKNPEEVGVHALLRFCLKSCKCANVWGIFSAADFKRICEKIAENLVFQKCF